MKLGAIKFFTDGSKQNDRVGAAFVIYDENTEVYYEYYRLPNYCTVYIAEVLAIDQTVKYLQDKYDVSKYIEMISDSRSALLSITNFKEDRAIIYNIRKFLI